jgi:hypothetical protein
VQKHHGAEKSRIRQLKHFRYLDSKHFFDKYGGKRSPVFVQTSTAYFYNSLYFEYHLQVFGASAEY